jgi:phosphoglycerate dehydrogenase-like enzyme
MLIAMRVVVELSNEVDVFRANAAQLAKLRAAVPKHTVVSVANSSELLAELPNADAVVVWRFLAEWYACAPRLRHVCTPAAGREHIARDPTLRVEAHHGTFHGRIMAESVAAMVLHMVRQLGTAWAEQEQHRWNRTPFAVNRRLQGQIALIVGYGTIGAHVARTLSALGMIVHGLKRDVTRGGEGAARLFGSAELGSALALADHVICILPGDTGTDHLLAREELARMKPSACVYNVGRGNAIDTEALRAALESRRIAGAFLDVVPEEPLPATSPLWTTPNLYITPHASAMTADYLDLYFEELSAWLSTLD